MQPIRVVYSPQQEAHFALVDWLSEDPFRLVVLLLFLGVFFGALLWCSQNRYR